MCVEKTMYMVIRTLIDLQGERYPVQKGECRSIVYSSDSAPKIVKQILNEETIEWGGALVDKASYVLIYNGSDRQEAFDRPHIIKDLESIQREMKEDAEKEIRVVKVSDGNSFYVKRNIENELLGLQNIEDGEEFTISFEIMTVGEYNNLPEFQGF